MRRFLAVCLLPDLLPVLAVIVCLASGLAFDRPMRLSAAEPAKGAKDEEEEEKIPDPEEVVLTTKDGVDLNATFYGGNRGKKSVPIICLHGLKGDSRDFENLALYLQSKGHAVIVPDLRGHGKSTKQKNPDTGRTETLDAAKFKPIEFFLMVTEDIEAVRRFLKEKNNAKELNIEKLCLIGNEMGASLALNYAVRDWSWPVLATGKQGQDVKALVLITPEWNSKGLKISEAVAHPAIRSELSVLIIAGNKGKSKEESQKLFKSFEKHHYEPPKDEDPEVVREKKDLFLVLAETSLKGAKLLNEKSLKVPATIEQFIALRLVNKQFPWSERTSPTDKK